jgi:hypothetical protein
MKLIARSSSYTSCAPSVFARAFRSFSALRRPRALCRLGSRRRPKTASPINCCGLDCQHNIKLPAGHVQLFFLSRRIRRPFPYVWPCICITMCAFPHVHLTDHEIRTRVPRMRMPSRGACNSSARKNSSSRSRASTELIGR